MKKELDSRKKPFILFISIVTPILVLAFLLVNEMVEVSESFVSLRTKTVPSVEILGSLDTAVGYFRVAELKRLLSERKSDSSKYDEELASKLDNIRMLRASYDKLNLSSADMVLATELDKEIDDYIRAHDALMQNLESGKYESAYNQGLDETQKEFTDVSVALRKMIEQHKKKATAIQNTLKHDEIVSKEMAFILSLVSVVIAALTAFLYWQVGKSNVKLSKQLTTDTLTELPNRNSLMEMLNIAGDGTLMLVNIDDFSQINDFYGHKIGDGVLVWLANKLKSKQASGSYSLFRMPSDEFAVFFHGENNSGSEFSKILAELLYSRGLVCDCMEQNIVISVTLGIAHGAGESLLKFADIALRNAKKSREHFVIYNDSMDPSMRYKHNMKWAEKLNTAISEDRITVYFQPIVDNKTGIVSKYESLVRMIDEDGTVVAPYKFLDIAKKSRLYYQITQIDTTKALQYFKDKSESVSINLSFEDIANERTNKFLLSQLASSGIADRVIFEILESEGIENFETVAQFIKSVQALGSKVAIDDFGSGYSNFDMILKLNIGILKIDGSLIKNIDKDEGAKMIVKTIVSFAKELGIETVAEFVHSAEVFNEVKNMGVDFSQGYFLSEPVSMKSL